MEQPTSSDIAKLLQNLEGGLSFVRKDAAEKLGSLTESNEQIVTALMVAKEIESNDEVKEAITKALLSPAHQAVIQLHTDLATKVAEKATARKAQLNEPDVDIIKRLRRFQILFGLYGVLYGVTTLGLLFLEPSLGLLIFTGIACICSWVAFVGLFKRTRTGYIFSIITCIFLLPSLAFTITGIMGISFFTKPEVRAEFR